jgi:hypothetical protein
VAVQRRFFPVGLEFVKVVTCPLSGKQTFTTG